MTDDNTMLRANEELLHQKELLERAEKIGKLGHWHVDLVKDTVFWSKEIYRIHGVTPDDYSPELQSAIDFYHEDDRAVVTNLLQQSIEKNEDFFFEARIIRPSGSVRFVRSSGECATDQNGTVISVFGTFQDVTEQTTLLQELEESRQHYKLAAEGANVGLWDWNAETGNTYFNEQWYIILGYEPYEFSPSFEAFQNLCHPSDFSSAQDVLNKHMEGTAEEYGIIIRMRHKSGEWRHVLTTGQAMERNEDGFATRVCGIHMDMTERVSNEEALKQANLELEEFAYRTSHDLRSPLVSSIGLLDVLKRALDTDNKEGAMKSIELITDSLVRLEALIKDILELTQTKNLEEDAALVNVEEMFDRAVEKLTHIENFDRLEIQKDFQVKQEILVKPSRINLIIENLLSNAIKYQDLEEKSSFVKISTYFQDGSFVLEFRDNGLGIPEQHVDKVFEMFRRFHTKVAFGSGLGLYMMKKSAEVLGGDIIYESLPKGSIFKFLVPTDKVMKE